VTTLQGLFVDIPPEVQQPHVIPIREPIPHEPVFSAPPLRDEQIHALVQQIFFTHESTLVRHVAFVTADPSTDGAALCLDVAKSLASENAYDVGLIDARPDSDPLQARLHIPSPTRAEGSWLIAPRLWIVPRQSWLPKASGQRIIDQNLTRLREITAEFDFSILYCAPASSLTTRIGQTCDGLILVLAANKTRRLVATQIKQEFSNAHVALLGSVLVDRRFPVPPGLYRSL
jgi:hypothetical protein